MNLNSELDFKSDHASLSGEPPTILSSDLVYHLNEVESVSQSKQSPPTYSGAANSECLMHDCSLSPLLRPGQCTNNDDQTNATQPLDLTTHSTPEGSDLSGPSPPPSMTHQNYYVRLFAKEQGNSFMKHVTKNLREVTLIKSSLDALEKRVISDISAFKTEIKENLSALDSQMDGAFGYVDTRMDVIFVDKICQIDEHFSETVALIDDKVQKQLSDFENTFSQRLSQFEEKCSSGLGPLEVSSLVKEAVDKYLSVKEVSLEPLLSCELMERFESQTASITNAFTVKHEVLQEELDDFKSTLVFLSSKDIVPGKTSPTRVSLAEMGKNLEFLTNWISVLLTDIKSNHKLLDNLELRSRGLNLVINRLAEKPEEDTLLYVGSLLAKFVPYLIGA